LPVLHGTLEECESGTKISVTMKLHGLVQLILVFFCGFEIKSLAEEGIKNYSIEFAFILVVAVIIFGGFWFENRLSKSAFLELFKDEIIAANLEDAQGQNAAR
jgi:heme/copper-type cytochrome/quinol oxidase subunit 4